ncbi:hypothetical protein [Nocardioides sp.]|uniref:hypothetical protein n=1 Tax=Nocardioides sp. TaxID=35761 RepID=UPI002606AE9C|nr:hypothetical protein [Nocardioides sp.]
MSTPMGQLIDSLGVTHEPADGELISDVVVLLKVITPDGRVCLRQAWSEGMSWIERIGMLRAAELSEHGDDD